MYFYKNFEGSNEILYIVNCRRVELSRLRDTNSWNNHTERDGSCMAIHSR